MADTGAIIAGAFRLVRERPLSVVAWGVIYVVASFALTFALLPVMMGQQAMEPGAPPNFSILGLVYLINFLIACLYLVLQSAAFRATYRPEESAGAYIRVGADEGRMILVWLILAVLFIIAFLVSALLMGILVGVTGFSMGSSSGAGGAIVMALVLGLVLFCFFLWLGVRLSLALAVVPLTRRVGLDVAWGATRGHFWSLFGAYLVIALLQLALTLIAFVPVLGTFFALIGTAMQNPGAAPINPMASLATGAGMMIYLGVAYVVVMGISIALWGGATATAARQLTGLSEADLDALEEDFR